jgi:hypothetical protein
LSDVNLINNVMGRNRSPRIVDQESPLNLYRHQVPLVRIFTYV